LAKQKNTKVHVIEISGYRYIREKISYTDPITGKAKQLLVYVKIKNTRPSLTEKLKLSMKVDRKRAEIEAEIAQTKKEAREQELGIKVFNSMFLEWYYAFVWPKQKANTREGWMKRYGYHIEQNFKGMQLSDITAIYLQRMFNQYDADGYSRDTQNHIYSDLNKFFDYCRGEEFIRNNPMRNIIVADQIKKDVKVITTEQLNRVLQQTIVSKHLKEHHRLGIIIAADEGLRGEEVMGICIEHYYPAVNELDIYRTVVDLREGEEKLLASDEMKSFFSRRSIKLLPSTVAAIEKYIAENQPLKKYSDGFTYLFQDKNGKFMSPRNLGAAYYKVATTLIKQDPTLKGMPTGIHNTRKHMTTVLKQAGLPSDQIARRMGHDPSMSDRTYTGRIVTDFTEAFQKIKNDKLKNNEDKGDK